MLFQANGRKSHFKRGLRPWEQIDYHVVVTANGPDRLPISDDATVLLQRVSQGDDSAAGELLPLVYEELRARAGAYFRGQPADHTLQPTALVHEAYVRLVKNPGTDWKDRAHFCAVAATAMRQILTNHAKRRALARDSHAERRQMMTSIVTPSSNTSVDVLALDEALTKLAELEERHARIVELRFFGGLTLEETAGVMNVSLSTINKDWRRIRAWLLRELQSEGTE